MSVFILRRFLTLLATLAGASLIIFLVLDALPGNAAQMLMGADASPDAVRALTVKLGLDQPLYARYLHWIGGMAVGDLGNSYAYGTPVAGLIMERLTLTIPLAILTNGLRVAGTGIAAHYYGSAAAEGFFHEFSGFMVFAAALVLEIQRERAFVRALREKARPHELLVERHVGARFAALVRLVRIFHLDYVRTENRELVGRERAREHVGAIENSDAFERSHRLVLQMGGPGRAVDVNQSEVCL